MRINTKAINVVKKTSNKYETYTLPSSSRSEDIGTNPVRFLTYGSFIRCSLFFKRTLNRIETKITSVAMKMTNPVLLSKTVLMEETLPKDAAEYKTIDIGIPIKR